MPISNRSFGVEIECFGLADYTIDDLFRRNGIECRLEGYNHTTRNHWKIVTDSSLRNNQGYQENCWEIVSPPLSGEIGLLQVQKVVNFLVRGGAKVNKTCGLHVHVDASELTSIDLVNIISRYAKFEPIIDSFMPRTRRIADQGYCKSVRYLSDTFQSSLADIHLYSPRRFIERYIADRMFRVNLLAYLRHGTVEFRQHSGSINAAKIMNWIKFCVNFVEQSKVNTSMFPTRTVQLRQNVSINGGPVQTEAYRSLSRKQRIVLDTLIVAREGNNNSNEFYDGVTISRLATLAGVAETSIPTIISAIRRAFNLNTRQLKKMTYTHSYKLHLRAIVQTQSDPTEVRMVSAEVQIPSLPNDENDVWSRGLETDVICFYEERITEMT